MEILQHSILRKQAVFVAPILAVCLSSLLVASEGKPTDKPLYTIDWMVESYDELTVYVNGIPVKALRNLKDRPVGRSGFHLLNWFLKDGKNKIRIVASKPNGRSGQCRARIMVRPDGTSYDKAKLLAMFERKGVGHEEVRFETTIKVSIPYTWSWQSAEQVQKLTDEDRKVMLDYIRNLHAAYRDKDRQRLLALMSKESSEEMAKAAYITPEEYVEYCQASLRRMFAVPKYEIAPLDEDAIQLTPYGSMVIATGDGAMVRARASLGPDTEAHWSPSVQRVIFVKLDGHWVAFVNI